MVFSQTSQYQWLNRNNRRNSFVYEHILGKIKTKYDTCTYMKPSPSDWIWVLLGVSINDKTINKLMGEINKKNSEDKFSKENQEPKNSNYSDLLLKKLWEQHVEKKKILIGITWLSDINYGLKFFIFSILTHTTK